MEKIFNQKNFNNFIWSPLGSRENMANLPPVSLTPVVHLEVRISPRIFEKIRNDPDVFIKSWGKVIHEKI
jgi:hypothetical protein